MSDKSTNTWICRGTIQPDCKMDIPVTYSDMNGTEKFDVILGDVETNKKFHYNLFSVTKTLLKGKVTN